LPTNDRGERISAVISLTELGYPKPTWDDARKLVAGLNRDAAFIVLAQLNPFLAVASIQADQNGDLKPRRFAQEKIISNIISAKRLDEIRQKVGNADLVDRILVHRSFVMAALRLVAMNAQVDGGNKLVSRDDFDVLGELALVLNAVTDPAGTNLTPCDLAAQLAPSREIENHPDLGLTLARMERMLGVHLRARARAEPAAAIAKRAEQVFTFVTNGLSFESFRDLAFAMFAYYSSLDLQDVLKDQGITYLNPHNPKNVIRAELLEQFLSLQSIDVADVPAYLAQGASDDRLLTDFTSFRRKPFWRFKDDAYLCVDPAFLMEKLAEGTYWWVMDGLGPEDDPESRERREQFSSLWGYIFEDYVDEQLRYAHTGREGIWNAHPHYVAPTEEAFDDVIVEGTDAVVIQCKSAFLPIGARYSGKCQPFFDGLNKQFGSEPRAAVEQLFRNIALVFGLDSHHRQVRGLELSKVRKVYPLAIVQEPMLGFWLAAKLLIEPFVKRVEATLWKLDVEIRPVAFMTVEELEGIAEYMKAGDFTLIEFLRDKHGMDRDYKLSVGQFLHGVFLPTRMLKRRRNELIAKELEQVKSDWLSRLKSGIYS
jgi:hypothetical protein